MSIQFLPENMLGGAVGKFPPSRFVKKKFLQGPRLVFPRWKRPYGWGVSAETAGFFCQKFDEKYIKIHHVYYRSIYVLLL